MVALDDVGRKEGQEHVSGEDSEKKRWLINRIDGMIEEFRYQWGDEYEAVGAEIDSISDTIMGWRKNGLTLIAFLITLVVSLAAVNFIDAGFLRNSLIVLAFSGIAVFFLLNWFHGQIMKRFELIDNAYVGGLRALHYLWGSFYSGGTLNFETMSVERIRTLDEFAKVALGALYVNVFLAYEITIKTLPGMLDNPDLRKTMEQLGVYSERAYQRFKEMRTQFMEPGLFSKDLLSMLDPFEFRFQKETRPVT